MRILVIADEKGNPIGLAIVPDEAVEPDPERLAALRGSKEHREHCAGCEIKHLCATHRAFLAEQN